MSNHAFLLIPLDYCPGDVGRGGLAIPDGVVDVFDLLYLLGRWATDNCIADLNQDGRVIVRPMMSRIVALRSAAPPASRCRG